jgi:hypothetical protein
MIIHLYNPEFSAFGDVFSSLSFSILYSPKITYSEKCQKNIITLIKSTLPLMKTKKELIIINQTNTHTNFLVQDHKEPYAKTKIQWNDFGRQRKSSKKRIISFQIESPGNPKWNSKRFFTNNEKIEFKKLQIKFFNKNIEFIPLGKPKSIEENIKILANSKFFFGIDSGMSHLAHAVGTPCYLKDFETKGGFGRGNLDFYHPNKQYTKFKKFSEIIPIITNI